MTFYKKVFFFLKMPRNIPPQEKESRVRRDKLGDDLTDLGILASKLEIVEKNEADSSFIGKLPSASFAEFMDLGGRLHRHYLRFGARL